MLDLPLGDDEAGGDEAVEAGGGNGERSRARWPWILLLVALAAGALVLGYWLRRDPALLTPSTSLVDFGVTRLGAGTDAGAAAADGEDVDATLEVLLTNSGGRAASLRGVEVSGPAAGEFAIREDGCSGLRLAAGESCRVRLRFSPTEDGPRRATLEVGGEGLASPLSLPLLGIGASGRLATVPEQVDFEPQTISERGPAVALTVDNRGTAAVSIADLRLEGAAASDFSASGCAGEELAAGESCTVSVRFIPRAAGERRASLRVVSDAPGRPPLVWLVGRGEERRAVLDLVPDPLDLGTALVRGAPTGASLTVRNRGEVPARVVSAAVADADLGFGIAADGCSGEELAPAARCEIAVRWAPAAAGPAETELTLSLAAGDGPRPAARLAGRGEGATLTAEPERLDFGTVRQGAEGESFLTLANPGRVAIPLERIGIEGTSREAADFVFGGDCRAGSRLPPAGTCTVTVRFRPRGSGESSVRLIAEAAGVRLGVPLTGRAAPPPSPRATVEPATLDLGAEAVGVRGPIREVRIGNRGDARLPLTGFDLEGAHAGDFRLVPGSCEGTTYIAPGAECTVGVRFLPSAAGARSATLVVRHGGAGGRSRVGLAGRGS